MAQRLKCLPPMWETRVQSLGREDRLEKEMVTHSSILAWRIPWTEKPGRLQSMGSQSRTRLSDFPFTCGSFIFLQGITGLKRFTACFLEPGIIHSSLSSPYQKALVSNLNPCEESEWFFMIPWTVAGQAPLFMGFSRQEFWGGLPFPSPWNNPRLLNNIN